MAAEGTQVRRSLHRAKTPPCLAHAQTHRRPLLCMAASVRKDIHGRRGHCRSSKLHYRREGQERPCWNPSLWLARTTTDHDGSADDLYHIDLANLATASAEAGDGGVFVAPSLEALSLETRHFVRQLGSLLRWFASMAVGLVEVEAAASSFARWMSEWRPRATVRRWPYEAGLWLCSVLVHSGASWVA